MNYLLSQVMDMESSCPTSPVTDRSISPKIVDPDLETRLLTPRRSLDVGVWVKEPKLDHGPSVVHRRLSFPLITFVLGR